MANPIFFVVRHGRTAGNEDNCYRGWSNKKQAQLNDDGRQDMREAGLYLKGLGIKFPLILADDLNRSQESEKILAKMLGIKEVEVDKRLRPLNVGDFTGKDKTENPLDDYAKHPSKKIPGGESMREFERRLSLVFTDIAELISQIKQPILIIGHGSTISYLHNAFNKGEKNVGYEGMVHPGGVLVFTKDGIEPLLKPKTEDSEDPDESEDAEEEKLDQAVVLYMDAKEIGKPKGAHCDDCRMFIGTKDALGKCGAVAGSIKPLGVCGLYVFGQPNQFTKSGNLSKETAGYIDNGPTHCGSCEYFEGEGSCKKVKSDPKTIEFGGCCNAYEPKKEEK